MAVTSLGIIGTATGSGGSLVIPITADVPACDNTTWREIIFYYVSFGFNADSDILSVSDDATQTFPNACYGDNPYRGLANLETDFGSGVTPSGLDEIERRGWWGAPVYQPLFNGVNEITCVTVGSPYWLGVIAIALEASTDGNPEGLANSSWFSSSDNCPGGGSICFTPENAGPAGTLTTFGVYALQQVYTTGTTSLTWADAGVALEGDMYDQGAGHVSFAVGTQAITPTTSFDIGGCSDQGCPDSYYSGTFSNGLLEGRVFPFGDGVGLDPCVVDSFSSIAARVGLGV